MKNKAKITLTSDYKKGTFKAILFINLFIITYLLCFLMSVVVLIASIYAAYLMIINYPMLLVIVFGLTLPATGILLLVFVLKFLFSVHRIDRSHLIEITQKDEPELVQLIHDVAIEVNTSMPKRIFFSAGVNASVFYDSSFWSMFFPVRKNLEIGIGLINTVTKEELKGIIAHEFGHFSQSTMKIGSYVYNMNKVMHNMLYENEGYTELTVKLQNVNGYIQLWTSLALKIVQFYKHLLFVTYKWMNKSSLQLSREMEFNADAIASSVVGHQVCQNALLRTSFSEEAFQTVFTLYNHGLEENSVSSNIYKDQELLLNSITEEIRIDEKLGLPILSESHIFVNANSKLYYTGDWESHPSTEDRIMRLKATGFKSTSVEDYRANEVLIDALRWQHFFSDPIFEQVPNGIEVSELSLIGAYKKMLRGEMPEVFKEYYANRSPLKFDLESQIVTCDLPLFSELISDEKIERVKELIQISSDLDQIQLIVSKDIQAKEFTYDGIKYSRQGGSKLLTKLQAVKEQLFEFVSTNDRALFHYFQNLELNAGVSGVLLSKYRKLYAFEETLETRWQLYQELSVQMQFIYVVTPSDLIISNLAKLVPVESKLKRELDLLLHDSQIRELLNPEQLEVLRRYNSQKWVYMRSNVYIDENIELFTQSVQLFAQLLQGGMHMHRMNVYKYQASLM